MGLRCELGAGGMGGQQGRLVRPERSKKGQRNRKVAVALCAVGVSSLTCSLDSLDAWLGLGQESRSCQALGGYSPEAGALPCALRAQTTGHAAAGVTAWTTCNGTVPSLPLLPLLHVITLAQSSAECGQKCHLAGL